MMYHCYQLLLRAIQSDPSVASAFADMDPESTPLIQFIYTLFDVTAYDKDVWSNLKKYFVGNQHVFQVITSSRDVARALLPTQYVASTKSILSAASSANQIPHVMERLGKSGEIYAVKLLNLKSSQPFYGAHSGKIVFIDLPIFGVTPDLLLLAKEDSSKSYPCDVAAKLDDPSIRGVLEVKAHQVATTQLAATATSAEQWIRATRAKGQAGELTYKKKNYQFPRPNWIDEADFKVCCAAIRSTRWHMDFPEDRDLDADSTCIKLFSGAIGRQLLAEMMAIVPHVQNCPLVTGKLVLINLFEDDLDGCVTGTLEIPRTTLLNMCQSLRRAFDQQYGEDIHEKSLNEFFLMPCHSSQGQRQQVGDDGADGVRDGDAKDDPVA